MRRPKKHSHGYRSIWKTVLRGVRGDSLIEFALLLPILMLMLMGIFDLSRAFYVHSVIANAAREGARYGVAHSDGSVQDVEDAAKALIVGLDPNEPTITVTCPTSETIHVDITYNFYVLTPLMAQFLSGQNYVILTSAATMYVEGTCAL
jgi:Flp pilus assembly protein TadG